MVELAEGVKAKLIAERLRHRATQLAGRLPCFAAAQSYLARGWRPIPIHQHEKRPLVQWREFQDRSPTLAETVKWWEEHPAARVGLVTGEGSGLVVVDVDPKHGGTVNDLEVPGGAARVRTPSGGVHFYMAHPGGQVANRAGIRPGVDVRADGGFVVAPPSPQYVAETPMEGPLPAAPEWVRARTGEQRRERAEQGWFAEAFARATPEGERNDSATRLAGYLFRRGFRPEEARVVLTDWAGRCTPPLPEAELDLVIASIASREAEKREEPPLRLLAPSALTVQEIRFTIDALVPAGTLTLCYGKDKVGKTLLALQMVKAIRTGSLFLDHFAAVHGDVIALLLDDPPGLVRERLVDNLQLADDGLLVATHLQANTDHPLRLLDALAAEAAARKPALIVVDALYVLLQGAEQLHLAGGMRPLMRALDRVAEESGAAVLLIHHPRKSDEEAAGSFVIRASAKSILRLTKLHEKDEEDGDPGGTTRRFLRVEGKYLPEAKYALDFAGPGRWTLLGEAGQVRAEELGVQLLAAVSRDPGLTAEQLAGRLSRREGDVRRALAALAQGGQVHSRQEQTGTRGRPRQNWWPGQASADPGMSRPAPTPPRAAGKREDGRGTWKDVG